MQNYNEILNKLKDILSKEIGNKKIFDKNISQALGIRYDNFRKKKSRGNIPYYEIMSFLAKRNISINWFFFNQLPESLIEPTSNYIILKYQRTVIASAGGGAINYEIDSNPLVLDKQLLDHIKSSYKYTEVVKVFGESMEPDIKDGSLVFIDKSQVDIKNTGAYLINTREGLFIKCIKIENDRIVLKSYNQAYYDTLMNINEVNIVGKVCGILIKG